MALKNTTVVNDGGVGSNVPKSTTTTTYTRSPGGTPQQNTNAQAVKKVQTKVTVQPTAKTAVNAGGTPVQPNVQTKPDVQSQLMGQRYIRDMAADQQVGQNVVNPLVQGLQNVNNSIQQSYQMPVQQKEQKVKNFLDYTGQSAAGQLLGSAAGTATSLNMLTNPIAAAPTNQELLDAGLTQEQIDRGMANQGEGGLPEFLSNASQNMMDRAAENGEGMTNAEKYISRGISGAIGQAPQMIANAVVPFGGDIWIGLSSFGNAWKDAKDHELSNVDALRYATANALTEVASNRWFQGSRFDSEGIFDGIKNNLLSKVTGTAPTLAAKVFADILGEQIEEESATIIEYLLNYDMLQENRDGDGNFDWQKLLGEVRDTWFDTLASTVVLNAVTGGYSTGQARRVLAEANSEELGQALLESAETFVEMSPEEQSVAIEAAAKMSGEDPSVVQQRVYEAAHNLYEQQMSDPSVETAVADNLQDKEPVAEYQGQQIMRSAADSSYEAMPMKALGGQLGREIVVVDELPYGADGVWMDDKILIPESVLAEGKGTWTVVKHELTHSLRNASGFNEFLDYAYNQMKNLKGDSFYDYYGKKLQQYSQAYSNSRQLFSDLVKEEVAAEYVQEYLFNDAQAIDQLVRSSRSTAQRIWQSLRDMVRKLVGIDDETTAALRRAERMFAQALAETAPAEEAEQYFDEQLNRDTATVGEEVDAFERNPMFSLKSLTHDIADGQMKRTLVSSGVFTASEAAQFMERLNQLMKLIEPKRAFLDLNEEDTRESRVFHPFKQNSDKLYKISLDFSTLCKKRIVTQAIIERLNMARGFALDAQTQFAIEQLLREYQKQNDTFQVACALCYVESARLKSPKVINQFMNNAQAEMIAYFAKETGTDNKAYMDAANAELRMAAGLDGNASKDSLKEAIAKMTQDQFVNTFSYMGDKLDGLYDPAWFNKKTGLMSKSAAGKFIQAFIDETRQETADILTDEQREMVDKVEELVRDHKELFLTADGLTELKRTEPQIYRAFTDKVRSATRSKALETNVAYYWGDSEGWATDALVKKMNQENGLRTQSWSDMQLEHLLDNIVAICELATKKAKMHGYTKVPEFVEVLGRTGLMINMSLIPEGRTGLDRNGNLIFSSTEGMPIETAMELRDKYANTAGTICIGINDRQILELMKSPMIDYIIPYHISGLTQHMRSIANIGGWKSYEKHQNERLMSDGKTAAKNGPDFSEWFTPVYEANQGASALDVMRMAQDRYLELCAERNLIPKFEMFLERGQDGSWHVPVGDDGQPINYWKLLIDRKMITDLTGDGSIIEQQAVRPDFVWEDEVGADGKVIRGLYSIVDQAEDPRTQEVVDELTNYVEDAMQSGVVAKIAKNDPQVKKAIEVFNMAHTPEAQEGEWSGDVIDDTEQPMPTMPAKQDAMFSLPSDSAYMAAVNRGDMDEAQRLVDEAARNAGYNVDAYHGTRESFNKFSRDKLGSRTGTRSSMNMFYAGDRDTANSYYPEGVLKELSETNPKMFSQKDIDRLRARGESGNLYHLRLNMQNPLDVDVSGYDYAAHRDNADAMMEYVDQAEREGRDGIILRNVRDNQLNPSEEKSTDYLFRNPNQAKLADSVTYDDQGNVIPLSERFNPKNDDIRYSLPSNKEYMDAVDSGNEEEQQRMVDEAAKVAGFNSPVVYHGTEEEFNTFRPSPWLREKNGDNRIKGYFSERRDYADRYGTQTKPYYVRIDNPLSFDDAPFDQTLDDWKKWFADKGVTGIEFDSSVYNDPLKGATWANGERTYSPYDLFNGADQWVGDGNLTERIAAAGYDGMRWDYDEQAWIPFNGNAIASADPVTYDDNGNVIPLSERFNPENNDIRWSLPSDEKEESFENYGISPKRIKSISNNLKRSWRTRMSPEQISDYLTNLYKGFDQSEYSEDEMRQLAEFAARDIANMIPQRKGISTESQMVLNALKETTIQLTEAQREEARATFGNLREFQKQIAPIKLRKDGTMLADAWNDWVEDSATNGILNPETYDDAMPAALAEVVQKLKNSTEESDYDYDLTVDGIVDDILNGYMESPQEPIEIPDNEFVQASVDELMGDGDGVVPMTDIDATGYAQRINGNSRRINGWDTFTRVLDTAAGGDKEVRRWFESIIDRPLYEQKRQYNENINRAHDSLEEIVKKTGIRAGTKESAAVQWYGENLRTNADGSTEKYGLTKLKNEFPNKWQDIVEMEQWCRRQYLEYVDRLNAMLEQIYPDIKERAMQRVATAQQNVESLTAQVENTQKHLDRGEYSAAFSTDSLRFLTEELAKAQKELADAQKNLDTGNYAVGKRVMPRRNYFHHFLDPQANGLGKLSDMFRAQEVLIDSSLVGVSDTTKPKSKWASFLQRRGNGEYTADAVGGMARYMPAAEYKIAIDPFISHMRGVVTELQRATSEKKNANNLIGYLSDWTNALAGKTGGIDRSVMELVDKVHGRADLDKIRAINGRFKGHAVGANIASAIKQISNIPTAMGQIKSNTAWAKGFGDYMKNNFMGDSGALDQSVFMTERYFDWDNDEFKPSSAGKKITDFSNWMMGVGDHEAAKLIWYAAYEEALEKGVDDPIFYADRATKDSVGGRGIGEVPVNLQSKVVNLLAPFQLEVTNTWNDLVKMVGERDARGVLRFMVGSWAMESMMEDVFGLDVLPDVIGTVIDTVQKSLKSRNNPEDDDEKKESIIGSAIREALGQIVSMIPGNSLIAQLVFGINSDTGEKLFGEGNPSRYELGLGGVKDLTQFGSDLAQVATGNKELRDVDLFTPLVEALLPFGGRQLTRSYKAAQDLGWMPYDTWGNLPFAGGERHEIPGAYTSKGDLKFELPDGVENVHDLTEIMKALLFGEYATDAGKEYLESGKKAMTSSKVAKAEAYADAGGSIEDYKNFLSQADTDGNGQTSLSEIREYLHNSGLSDDDQVNLWKQNVSAERAAKADAFAEKGYDPKDYYLFDINADADGSGNISMKEARQYFEESQLPDGEQTAIWETIISDSKKEKLDKYTAEGYDPEDFLMFDIHADADGNGSVSQAETTSYLDSTDLDKDQKSLIFMLMFPKSEKKNPYK